LEDGKWLSGCQKIRAQRHKASCGVIRTAGYQIKNRRWDGGGVVRVVKVVRAGEWYLNTGFSMLDAGRNTNI